MHRNTETVREKYDHLSQTLQASKAMRMRFKLISKSTLSEFTVDDVRDMNLGFPNSKLAGSNAFQFSNNTIEFIQTGYKVAGKVMFVISVITSGIKIKKAIDYELDIDTKIEALEYTVDCLEEDLRNKKDKETEKALKFAKILLEDARDCKRNPGKKTILTSLCVGGELGGAWAMGSAGAAIGALGGPVGAIAGAVAGGVVGKVVGSKLVATTVENFRCDEDGIATEMQGSLVDFGDKVQGQVIGLDGNVFLGKGVEVGARAALFQMAEKDEGSLTVGKAGANFGITNKGVDVGVESKVLWAEAETKNVKIGTGFNLDTGVQVKEDGVQMSALGFGFSAGDDGVGVKLPFLNVKWKF